METASQTDMRVGFAVVFGLLGFLGAVGMVAFGLTGDQLAAGLSFAVAMLAGTLVIVVSHIYP